MLNTVSVMGRLTREPELKRTSAGVAVCTVTLAVERDYADSNGVREADFIDVVCWRQTAEFTARYFRKGLLVAAEGRLQTRRWRDRHEQNRVTVEVVAEHCYFAERADRPASDGGNSDANRRSVRGGRGEGFGAEQPSGEAVKAGEWGFRGRAADITADTPEYAGDLYRSGSERERLFAAYNAGASGKAVSRGGDVLPKSDYYGMDDEEIPF